MHPATRVLIGIFFLSIAMLCMAPAALGYDEYTGCATCHGGFRDRPYVSLADGETWTYSLHDAHRAIMLNADCRTCHQDTTFFPVLLGTSAGGAGLAPLSCAGCHGRTADDQGFLRGPGAGLRQHHFRARIQICGDCHADANPAYYTPVGENVPPPYYANPGTNHAGIPDDPGNYGGSEDIDGGPTGLDNDGDLLYDTNDPDCPVPVPDIEVTPTSIAFGDVAAGTIAERIYGIRNIGTALLTLSDVRLFSLAGTGEWGAESPSVLTLAPGASMHLAVDFRPADPGAETATLHIDSDDPDTPRFSMALSGTGVATPTTGLRVTPLVLDFLGVEIGDGLPMQVTLENLDLTPITITAIELDPATDAAFHFHDPTVPPLPFILAGGASHVIELGFAPTVLGAHVGTLVLVRDDPGGPGREIVRVGLVGEGILGPHGDLDVQPANVAFGDVLVNDSSTRTITLGNVGTATLTIDTLTLPANPEFHFVPGPPTTPFDIAPGTSLRLDLHFDPLDIGPEAGMLTIESTDPHVPNWEVPLSGVGLDPPVISVSPGSVTMPDTAIGMGTARVVSIANLGSSPLAISALGVGGPEFDLMLMGPPTPFAIPPGSHAVVWITYFPVDAGLDNDTLRIDCNDPVAPTMLVALEGTGLSRLEPDIRVTPLSHDFGAVEVGGMSTTLDVAIRNVGVAPLAIADVGIDNVVGAPGYTHSALAGVTINPGGLRVVTVRFVPLATGPSQARFYVRSDDPDTPLVTVPVSGLGTPATEPDIRVTPASLGFGTVPVGSTSAPQTITIANVGTGTLSVSSVGLDPVSGVPRFRLIGPAVLPLPPGASALLQVVFEPLAAGSAMADLVVHSDDPDSPEVRRPLTGTGVPPGVPDIAVTPASLDYGTVVVGATSAPQTITITNNGNATLTVGSVGLDPVSGVPRFRLIGPAVLPLPPGASALLQVVFEPLAAGSAMADLVVHSNDPDSPEVRRPLTGTGIPPGVPNIAVLPSALHFGDVLVGATSAPQTVTITNTGTSALTISDAGIDVLAGVRGYRLTGPTSLVLGVGEAHALTVAFEPLAVGISRARMHIDSDDPDTPVVLLMVTGQGVMTPATGIEVTPLSIDFGDVGIGMHGHDDVVIRNVGAVPLTITGWDFGGHAEFLVDATPELPPFQLDPGQHLTAMLAYSPVDPGADTGTFTIVSDDAVAPTVTVDLAGRGTQVSTLLDLDFDALETAPILKLGDSWLMWIDLRVINNGSVEGAAPATVTAVQDGVEIYRETRLVSDGLDPGLSWFKFPWLWTDSRAPITWTVFIDDEDPDVDVHTAVKLGLGAP